MAFMQPEIVKDEFYLIDTNDGMYVVPMHVCGAGFWDGDWPDDIGTLLTDASKTFGEVNLYVGDDGNIHCDRG